MTVLQRHFARIACCAAVACTCALAWPIEAPAGGHDARLPPKYRKPPYSVMSLSVGYPNDGWQLRALRLRKRPQLAIQSTSDGESWGHPALVKMLARSAQDIARAANGSVMLVGDLSAKGGGPLPGHASHQSGRDADIGFYARDARGNSVRLRRFVAFGGDGKAKDGSGLVFDDHRNWLALQAWMNDHRAGLSHVFVSQPLRKRLLAFAARTPAYRKQGRRAAAILKQPARGEPHDDHFHVRITCPKRQKEICHEEPRARRKRTGLWSLHLPAPER